MVGQWLRAARADTPWRATALRYAMGIIVCQVGWVMLLFLPVSVQGIGFVVMAMAEILVPIWAEQAAATTWHPGHIAERYGLFTIIVRSKLQVGKALDAIIPRMTQRQLTHWIPVDSLDISATNLTARKAQFRLWKILPTSTAPTLAMC